jgi:hypothetical protein
MVQARLGYAHIPGRFAFLPEPMQGVCPSFEIKGRRHPRCKRVFALEYLCVAARD